jgi:hypothetical protein
MQEKQESTGKVEDAVRTYSRPSDLKVTDMRVAVVCSNYDYPIIRLDTNQDLCGIGEVRDAGHKQVKDAIDVPIAAGEEVYLWDGFREMIEKRAVDIIHPDLLTSGGMLETKKIADYAERYGLPTALHFAGSPIAFMANLHCAAAIPSFVALEHHGLDLPFWADLVTGLPKNYIEDGYVAVPEKPGLGVDLNCEVIEQNLRFPGLFEPTEEWNAPKLDFWQPDRRWNT